MPEYNLEFGHRESRQGDEANGLYHVLLPDGRTQIVEYEADQDGYKPKVSYQEASNGGAAGQNGGAGFGNGAGYGNGGSAGYSGGAGGLGGASGAGGYGGQNGAGYSAGKCNFFLCKNK